MGLSLQLRSDDLLLLLRLDQVLLRMLRLQLIPAVQFLTQFLLFLGGRLGSLTRASIWVLVLGGILKQIFALVRLVLGGIHSGYRPEAQISFVVLFGCDGFGRANALNDCWLDDRLGVW